MDEKENGVEEVRSIMLINIDNYCTSGAHIYPQDGNLILRTFYIIDMAVLAGSKPEKCMAKYGSLPLKSSYYHEMSLRILLMTVDSAANRHGRYIEPWISLSVSTICHLLRDNRALHG